jgi:hypothetical protein
MAGAPYRAGVVKRILVIKASDDGRSHADVCAGRHAGTRRAVTDQLAPPPPTVAPPTRSRSAVVWKIATGVLAAISLVTITVLVTRDDSNKTLTVTFDTTPAEAAAAKAAELAQRCAAERDAIQASSAIFFASASRYPTSVQEIIDAGWLTPASFDSGSLMPDRWDLRPNGAGAPATILPVHGGPCDL